MFKGAKEILLLFFILIAIMPHVSASVMINEVMYNPNTSVGGTYNEWIEIKCEENINLTLKDYGSPNKTTDFECNNTYVLIARNTTLFCNFFSCSGITLVKGSLILDNDGDTLELLNNTSTLNIFNYNKSLGANGDGNSLQLVNNSWCANLPTPGASNNCTIPNQPPTANFVFSPANPTANQTVTFDASSSSDADGSITLYSWNFSDGTNAAGNTTQHAFNTAGSFTVNLTVMDNSNATNSTVRTIGVVQNQTQQNQTNQTQQNAMLEITYAPSEAYFGSEIQINISVYRNDTAKYAVYLWIWDNERELLTENISLHAKNSTNGKLTNYTFNASLEIDKECNVTNKTFMIVLEGMYEKINKSITLKENITLCLPDFQYLITPITTAKINETFSTKVRITNNKNTDTEFDVWSYAYRGSKCYSCLDDERDENLNHVLVEANSYTEFLLDNIIENAEPGNYSLRVKILSEEGEESFSKTFNLVLEASSIELQEEIATESNLNAQTLNTSNKTLATGKAIYKSKTELNKRYAEIILISLFVLTLLYFIFKPKIIAIREHGV